MGLSVAFVSPPKKLLNALDHGKIASHSITWCSYSSAIYKFTGRLNWLGFSLGAYLILDSGLEVVCP